MTFDDLQALLRLTLTNPRAAARAVKGLHLSEATGWTALPLVPPIAPLLGIAAFALYIALLTLFIAELHGFTSAILVFGGILATSFLTAIPVAILLLAIFGAPANV